MAFTAPEKVAFTTAAVIVNVPVAEPAETVTEDGTAAWLLVLVSETTTPPAGAALASVTFPTAVVPLGMAEGVILRAVSTTGLPTTRANEVEGIPFVTTSSVETPVSMPAGTLKFVETGVAPVATPIEL